MVIVPLTLFVTHIVDLRSTELAYRSRDLTSHHILKPYVYVLCKLCKTRKQAVFIGLSMLTLRPLCLKFSVYDNANRASKSALRIMLASSIRINIFPRIFSLRYIRVDRCIVELIVCELGRPLVYSTENINHVDFKLFLEMISKLKRYGFKISDLRPRNLVLVKNGNIKIRICDYECIAPHSV